MNLEKSFYRLQWTWVAMLVVPQGCYLNLQAAYEPDTESNTIADENTDEDTAAHENDSADTGGGADSDSDTTSTAKSETDSHTEIDSESDTDADVDTETDTHKDIPTTDSDDTDSKEGTGEEPPQDPLNSDVDTDTEAIFDTASALETETETPCKEGFTGQECKRCVIYVDGDNGNDDKPGTTWRVAKKTINAGIAKAAFESETERCDVWVAQGTYALNPTAPETDAGVTESSRQMTIRLLENVAVYGGFEPNETFFNHRSAAENTTIIDGGGVFHVVTGAEGATLDGFTIVGGKADVGDDVYGGGMLNTGVSPVVRNCTFYGNSAAYGGGMANLKGASPIVSHVTFKENVAERLGGGLFSAGTTATGSAYLVVDRGTFIANTADHGGAVYNQQKNARITNSLFFDNRAKEQGAAVYSDSSTTVMMNATFYNNSNRDNDGGDATEVINDARSSIYVSNDIPGSTPSALTNSIVWGDTVSETPIVIGGENASALNVTFSNIQLAPSMIYATGNINSDPGFVSTDIANGGPDLRLSCPSEEECSPCVDTGNAGVIEDEVLDLAGNQRMVDISGVGEKKVTIDMGAYEVQAIDKPTK